VVISASSELAALGRDEIQQVIMGELASLLPGMSDAKLLRCRVVTERTATFRAVPGVDDLRPVQQSPLPGLFLAGDYTSTGWPATMEGAVRSGELVAAAVLQQQHQQPMIRLQPQP
jgi:uncharacterized protein with NAD-binding domain and iron-sulfur cluster